MDLRLRAKHLAGAVLIEVGGEVDLHSAPQLRAELVRADEDSKSRVVVDLSEVTFIDSTGIGVLVGALKRAREKGGTLNFCSPQARVKRVFEITGLLRALPLFETRDAALDALNDKSDTGEKAALNGKASSTAKTDSSGQSEANPHE